MCTTNTPCLVQGNSYDTRSQPSGNAYHYSNTGESALWVIVGTSTDMVSDGSYYYSNGNGSTYHNNGNGGSTYTAPNGNVYKK